MLVIYRSTAGLRPRRRMWPVYAAALNEWFVSALDEDEADRVAGTVARVVEHASPDLERASA